MPDPSPEYVAKHADEFWALVDKRLECWLWLGNLTSGGYGRFRGTKAYRFAWLATNGHIASGLVLDHLCRTRACCRPAHLEPVTQTENVRRGLSLSGRRFRQTHCAKGHPLDRWCTFPVSGKRYRACSVCPPYKGSYRQLTPDRVREVRALRASGLKLHEIAAEVGISKSQVHRIVSGEDWKQVPEEVAV